MAKPFVGCRRIRRRERVKEGHVPSKIRHKQVDEVVGHAVADDDT